MAAGDLETRFAHLLKPIRDLSKNWEIDIASQLEEYLDQVDHITITFDNGATSMNFAEAAMVIQGSACVYSKKVEYLYSMVYQVLDLLASKKKLQQAGSVGEGGDDQDAPRNDEQEEEFLTLDDIKEHNNIDMKEKDGKKTVQDIPQTPLALTKLDETEKGDNPLIGTNGEVIANRYDFKMNLSHMHKSAMMLLDMSHLSLLEASMFQKPSSTPFHPLPKSRLADEPPPPLSDDKDDSGHIDEGLPSDINMDADGPGDMDDLPPVSAPASPEKSNQMQLRVRTKPAIITPAKPFIDPWRILEPHDPLVNVTDKPMKKAKTFRVPASLDSDSTKKRKRKKDPVVEKLQPINEFSLKAYYSAVARFPSNPLRVPFPEFEPLYWKELQRRKHKLKNVRKQLAAKQIHPEELEAEEQEDEIENLPADLGTGDVDEDDDFHVPEIPVVDYMEGERLEHCFPDRTVADSVPLVNSYEELVRQHVEGFMASAQQYAHTTELTRRVAEWEQKIIPRLEEEDRHEPFDIHKYGTSVMDKIPDASRKRKECMPFREIVSGKPAFQVCRLFLATLQLANNYNVEISADGILDEGVDTMAVKFLSTKRHFEELQEYRAPSVKP